MTEPTITCPKCQSEIKLTESLAGPLVEQTRRAFAEQLSAKDAQIAMVQAEIAAEKTQLEAQRQGIDATLAARLDTERKKIIQDETERAKRAVALDIEGRECFDQRNPLAEVYALFRRMIAETTASQ